MPIDILPVEHHTRREGRWHEVIGDHTIGDAILDRVIHRAHRLELKGPSMRKRHNAEVSAAANTGLTNAKEK